VNALDPATVDGLARQVSPKDFSEILRTFRDDLGRLASRMPEQAAAGAVEELRRTAHALAGTAGAIGARRLDAAARRAMDRNDAMPLAERVAQIEQEAAAALAALAALADAPPAG
jgi:HPt (histidine-containing phosphotransfer) domain-containing protein